MGLVPRGLWANRHCGWPNSLIIQIADPPPPWPGPNPRPIGPQFVSGHRWFAGMRAEGGVQTCITRARGRGRCPQEAMRENKEALVVMEKQVSAVAETTKHEAEEITKSDQLISALQQAKDELMKVGAIAAAIALGNEIKKEERRRRAFCKTSPAVMNAMKLQRDFEERQQIERKRLLDEANTKLVAERKRELKEVERQVRQRKN